jgi:hypothetical protein
MVRHTYITSMPETVRALLEPTPDKIEKEKEMEEFIWLSEEEQRRSGVFYATVKVYEGALKITTADLKSKKVTVPKTMLTFLESGKPGVWKMRILDEKDDHIFAKPIEFIEINNDGMR